MFYPEPKGINPLLCVAIGVISAMVGKSILKEFDDDNSRCV